MVEISTVIVISTAVKVVHLINMTKTQDTRNKIQTIWNLRYWNLIVSWKLGFGTSSNAGFTLIELIIVIGILAILAVFALAALNPLAQFRKARDGERKSDLAQIQRVLEQYYQDHGNYPKSSSSYTITDFNGVSLGWGASGGWSPYMDLVPKDPDSSRTYVYYAPGGSPQSYYLYTSIEQGPNDTQTCKATVSNCINNPESLTYCTCGNVPAAVDCGASGKHHPCNYGVSSPNTTP